MVNESYPLHWPIGWSRQAEQKSSRFLQGVGSRKQKPSIYFATNSVVQEIQRLGGSDFIISTNLKLKKDGLPYSNQKEPADKGVAVYFVYQKEQKVIACDQYDRIACNLWAVAKTIEAMRGIDRWGCSEILNRAFTGFTALPQNASTSVNTWYSVLEVDHFADEPEVKEAYRKLSKKYHPDNFFTGDSEMFIKVNNAWKEYQQIYLTNN